MCTWFSKDEIINILGKSHAIGLKIALVVNEVQPHLRRVRVVGEGEAGTVIEAKVHSVKRD